MAASPLTGIKPMLASKGVVSIATLVGSHAFDEKLDGLRAMVAFDGERVWLKGRNGADLLRCFPEIEEAALLLLPVGVVLDGELTTTTFEDVNHRAMLRPDRAKFAALREPATFNAFDVVRHPHHSAPEVSWEMRRRLLDAIPLNGCFRATTWSDRPEYFDEIRARGGEGVIAKRIQSRYQAGRSADWIKFKSTHRVTCIAYGYERGSGARADFGAVMLAMVDHTGTVTQVGRAGSGFTARTIAVVKEALDDQRLTVVEIECLGVTSGNQLRQPVFKGVRADLSLLDASTTQLNTLPKG